MINNRQGGRRRGRGGQRPQNPGGRPDGNRQDNRQRGNAAQLLEKYKGLARDAQLSGDRVQSEYYLQFADHYFRVLSESRARFEDQRRSRDDESDDEGDDEMIEASDEDGGDGRDDEQRFERRERGERQDRPERTERTERPDRGERSERRGRRFGRDERNGERVPDRINGSGNGAYAEGIPADVLPPAIGLEEPAAASSEDEPQEEAARPRRRLRKPRAEDGDIAPAA